MGSGGWSVPALLENPADLGSNPGGAILLESSEKIIFLWLSDESFKNRVLFLAENGRNNH